MNPFSFCLCTVAGSAMKVTTTTMTRMIFLMTVLTFASVFAASSPSPAQRAQELLLNMTLVDKISLLHGVDNNGYTGATSGVSTSNVSIPPLLFNDGRQGFRPNNAANTQTAFPCQLCNVATWRPELVFQFAQAMSEEFYGKGANVVLAPMLILTRVPVDGRAFESIGEDPELAYGMAFSHVSGVQSVPGVLCNADDYVLNNQETNRQSISAVCDERTRFEMYYRGYKGAIDAGTSSIMCSYNRINGTYSCENNVTLGDLRNERGLNFSGYVLSDWGGTHSCINAAVAGLDMQLPDASYFGTPLLQAVQDGEIPMSLIDEKVLRILTPMFAAGLFDNPSSGGNQSTNVTSEAHNTLARTLAAAGTVLLSNTNNLLPLSATSLKNIAVIGDDGDFDPRCCGTGSGALYPPYLITPYQGIKARAGGNVNTTYYLTPGITSNITQWYSTTRGDHFLDYTCEECSDLYVPLRSEGFAFETPAACSTSYGCVELMLYYNPTTSSNLVTTSAFPIPDGYQYVRPSAYIVPLNYSGPGETQVLELWKGYDTPTGGGAPPLSHLDFFTLATDESRAEAVAANYTKVGELGLIFTSATSSPDFAAVVAAAVAADVAIVCMSTPSGEGSDRSDLSLAPTDDMLVAAIVAAQPKTIVVLHNPGAVVMPWADDAGAILSAWFAGQEMGNALADILFGDVNPSGRLPVTFPMTNEDTPMQTPEQFPGVNGTVVYSEKLLFGYRYWDATNTTPRFPFGHGLSYTTFAYSDLVIDSTSHAPNVTVQATITNTGSVDGIEIVQCYLSFPAAAGEPPRVLRGFTSVSLAAASATAAAATAVGSSSAVTFTIVPRDMSIWDTDVYGWSQIPGEYEVFVGASSRDLRLSGSFTV